MSRRTRHSTKTIVNYITWFLKDYGERIFMEHSCRLTELRSKIQDDSYFDVVESRFGFHSAHCPWAIDDVICSSNNCCCAIIDENEQEANYIIEEYMRIYNHHNCNNYD